MPRTGRPRLAPAPACPQGHAGTVHLHGLRTRRGDARFARPRYRCIRDEGGQTIRHTFTLARRAPTVVHPDGAVCENCEHKMARGDGLVALPSFSYALVEAARLATLVGEGQSLREASQQIRIAGGRVKGDRHGRTWASRQNALAADYLDQFGPVIVRAMTPRRWPRIVVLDSTPLGIRPRGTVANGFRFGREGGAVLVAAGRERFQPRTRTWLATLAADESEASWVEFLGELESDPPPFWVVADGSKAIRNAVATVWPSAVFYPCEYHLRERAVEHATRDGRQTDPVVVEAIERAFWDVEHWDALGVVAQSAGPSNLWQWWAKTDGDARMMCQLKAQFADYPNANGPAEWPARAIRDRIGERKRTFRNASRLATVVALMGIHTAEQASPARYAKALRTQFELSGWKPGDPWPGHDWERHHDPAGNDSSFDEMIFDSWRRDDLRRRRWGSPAQVSASMQRKAAAVNVLRLAAGVAPLALSSYRVGAVASVSVSGKKLRDFPELLAEWDRELNPDPDPASLPAGRTAKAHWVCARGHHWMAKIYMRTIRLSGCPRCRRSWANEENSLAGLRPALLAEWDEAANAPRIPERVKANSTTVFVWRCLARPDHAVYRISVRTRVRKFDEGRPACPACRAIERTELQRARPWKRGRPKKEGAPN